MSKIPQSDHNRLTRAAADVDTVPPASPGTYALVLFARRGRTVVIGRFGSRRFDPGYYVYVGSAFGSGGLRARLAHHVRLAARPRWHIDYLRAALRLEEIWYAPGSIRRESLWARTLARLPGATLPVSGFGASDQRGATHLAGFPGRPKLHRLVSALRRVAPAHEPVLRQVMRRGKAVGARRTYGCRVRNASTADATLP